MGKGFTDKAREEMPSIIRKGIDNLLSVLNSRISYPTTKSGCVDEPKLLAVVKSREEVYKEICRLMDLINIDKSNDSKYKGEIIKGLKTTWGELKNITIRPIGNLDEEEEDNDSYNLSDDKITPIAKSIGLSASLASEIIERIELLENKEMVHRRKIDNQKIGSIAERFAK